MKTVKRTVKTHFLGVITEHEISYKVPENIDEIHALLSDEEILYMAKHRCFVRAQIKKQAKEHEKCVQRSKNLQKLAESSVETWETE